MECNQLLWYNQSWVVAVFSAGLAIFSTLAVQGILSWWNIAKKRKELLLKMIAEILANKTVHEKSIAKIKNTLEEFKNAVNSNFETGHPSAGHYNVGFTKDFFILFTEHLFLLKDKEKYLKINLLYTYHLAHVEASEQKVDKGFERFYGKNPMVGHRDIINNIDELIRNKKSFIDAANDVVTDLLILTDESNDIAEGKEKKYSDNREEINKFITNSSDTEFDVRELEDNLQINVISILVYLKEDSKIKQISATKFKKIK